MKEGSNLHIFTWKEEEQRAVAAHCFNLRGGLEDMDYGHWSCINLHLGLAT